MTDVKVSNDESHNRYEARLEGELVGAAYYHAADDLIVFTHTEVEPAHEGHGVGSQLAQGALDDVRRDGSRKVVARCEFIKAYIEHHPDYQDLLE